MNLIEYEPEVVGCDEEFTAVYTTSPTCSAAFRLMHPKFTLWTVLLSIIVRSLVQPDIVRSLMVSFLGLFRHLILEFWSHARCKLLVSACIIYGLI
jgi:hypothetical protein